MTTSKSKAYELYEKYLKGYLILTEPIMARIRARECCEMICNERIDELNTFGDSNNALYTIEFWEEVLNEIKNI